MFLFKRKKRDDDEPVDMNARSLLQVNVKAIDEADDIFTKLMGDIVEPRREFIQENALAASVDV